MEPLRPAMVRKRRPGVRRSASMVTPSPTWRTNTLVLEFSLILSDVSHLVSVADAMSLHGFTSDR